LNGGSISATGVPRVTVQTAAHALHVQKYLPIAVLYFFLNSAGLPTGLFYTGILSPLFFLWLFRHGKTVDNIQIPGLFIAFRRGARNHWN